MGEFEIRGPWITGSYYKDEDPAKFDDGWLRTGDVGTLDTQGYMTISDRTKDVIKSGGEWISSVELENAVMGHPDVFEAAVIAIPDPKWSERPLVAVVPKPGRTPAPADLLDYLVDRVPRWWLPDQWTFVVEIPKTSVGKFDKKVMRARLRRRRLHGAAHAPAQVSGSNEAVDELADRLEGVLEELTDMALDALRLASAGDPDSAETGEALALEKRILKARRALERCGGRTARRVPAPPPRRSTRAPAEPHGPVRTFVAAWPDERDAPAAGRPRAGPGEEPAAGGADPLARHAALPGRGDRGGARAPG